MIFDELLADKHKTISPLFDRLFDLALEKQPHCDDLLLVM